jgi:tetratricopeptide (TPR) repeat protein
MNKKFLSPLLFGLYSTVALANMELTPAQKELQMIAEAAEAAVTQGQWQEAKKRWKLALQKVEAAAGDDEYRAILHYEYGRASGVLCDWDNAATNLQEALRLDKKTNGPFFTSLLELARLNLTQENYEQAKGFYDELLPELKSREAAIIDPIGSADIISEYATVLEALDAGHLAVPYREMATQWREQHQGFAAETLKTPYGSKCQ